MLVAEAIRIAAENGGSMKIAALGAEISARWGAARYRTALERAGNRHSIKRALEIASPRGTWTFDGDFVTYNKQTSATAGRDIANVRSVTREAPFGTGRGGAHTAAPPAHAPMARPSPCVVSVLRVVANSLRRTSQTSLERGLVATELESDALRSLGRQRVDAAIGAVGASTFMEAVLSSASSWVMKCTDRPDSLRLRSRHSIPEFVDEPVTMGGGFGDAAGEAAYASMHFDYRQQGMTASTAGSDSTVSQTDAKIVASDDGHSTTAPSTLSHAEGNSGLHAISSHGAIGSSDVTEKDDEQVQWPDMRLDQLLASPPTSARGRSHGEETGGLSSSAPAFGLDQLDGLPGAALGEMSTTSSTIGASDGLFSAPAASVATSSPEQFYYGDRIASTVAPSSAAGSMPGTMWANVSSLARPPATAPGAAQFPPHSMIRRPAAMLDHARERSTPDESRLAVLEVLHRELCRAPDHIVQLSILGPLMRAAVTSTAWMELMQSERVKKTTDLIRNLCGRHTDFTFGRTAGGSAELASDRPRLDEMQDEMAALLARIAERPPPPAGGAGAAGPLRPRGGKAVSCVEDLELPRKLAWSRYATPGEILVMSVCYRIILDTPATPEGLHCSDIGDLGNRVIAILGREQYAAGTAQQKLGELLTSKGSQNIRLLPRKGKVGVMDAVLNTPRLERLLKDGYFARASAASSASSSSSVASALQGAASAPRVVTAAPAASRVAPPLLHGSVVAPGPVTARPPPLVPPPPVPAPAPVDDPRDYARCREARYALRHAAGADGWADYSAVTSLLGPDAEAEAGQADLLVLLQREESVELRTTRAGLQIRLAMA